MRWPKRDDPALPPEPAAPDGYTRFERRGFHEKTDEWNREATFIATAKVRHAGVIVALSHGPEQDVIQLDSGETLVSMRGEVWIRRRVGEHFEADARHTLTETEVLNPQRRSRSWRV